MKVPKGVIVYICKDSSLNATVSIDSNAYKFITDYQIKNGALVPLDTAGSYSFNFNCIIDVNHYKNTLIIQHSYLNTGYFDITVSFKNTTVKAIKNVFIYMSK